MTLNSLHPQRYWDTFKAFKSLDLPRGANILDVGCGVGYLSFEIKNLGYNVYGVDKDIENVKSKSPDITISKLENETLPFDREYFKSKSPDITISKCDVENETLPFDREYFDCVLFTEVIEHLDPRKLCFVLNEIRRVLKEKGILLMTTPNQASFQNAIRLLLGRRIILNLDHIREYVRAEIFEILEKSRFKPYKEVYLLSCDKVLSRSRGYITTSNKTNIARALLYPIKLLIPRFRNLILILARKL